MKVCVRTCGRVRPRLRPPHCGRLLVSVQATQRRAAACATHTGVAAGTPPRASVLAPPRSLLVFTGEAYTRCLHGIDEVRARVRVRGCAHTCMAQHGQRPP
jgi:hypothetical protein